MQYLFTNKLYKKLFNPVLFSCDEITLKTKRIAMVKKWFIKTIEFYVKTMLLPSSYLSTSATCINLDTVCNYVLKTVDDGERIT